MPHFSLGMTVITPGALAAFERTGEKPQSYLARHHGQDFGDLCKDDLEADLYALEHGLRLLSAYHLRDRTKIWIVTEADRSSTCILLPAEY